MRRFLPVLFALIFCPILVAQQAMNNDAVIKMAKAGLSDDVIVATVNSSPGSYSTTADGLIALKQAGVSDKVIAAIVAKNTSPVTASATAQAANGLPPGITDVGVYYKDKNGAWTALMPEMVDFKSGGGGLFKTIASAGVLKGDVNGYVQGAHAKLSLNFPVDLAVYVPEGTAITEYQLLRMHSNADTRQFLSATGGVLHTTNGAKRDSVEFQSEELSPRVFRITLKEALGAGEYGLLPPVSNGNSGKIYAASVIQ